MADVVSNTGNLILTSLFYSPLIPVTIPIALVGLFLSYWVQKWNLINVHRLPEMYNGVLALFLSNLLPYFTLLWAAAYFFMYDGFISNRDNKDASLAKIILPFIALILVAVFVVFPIRTLINKCFSDTKEDVQ